MARQSVWANPEVTKLLAQFVPAADEVWSLQNRKDPEALLFQKIAEQGHYAGRTQPSNTRQGIYATTPSGVLLASINSNSPQAMADMMRRALDKWKNLEEKDKWLEGEIDPAAAKGRPESFYPQDGLVLRQTVRDLPREKLADGWRGQAWNKDYVWFTKAEARSMVPSEQTVAVPRPLLQRLARFTLKDTVRGQAPSYPANAIQEIELQASVVERTAEIVRMKLTGRAKAEEAGRWAISGYRDMASPSDQKRGFDLRLAGRATWNTKLERFTEFELVAAGTRWGATQYNGRFDDLGPAPIGFLFQLASDKPVDKVPPSEFWGYGWGR